jgi:hypothetical protein
MRPWTRCTRAVDVERDRLDAANQHDLASAAPGDHERLVHELGRRERLPVGPAGDARHGAERQCGVAWHLAHAVVG